MSCLVVQLRLTFASSSKQTWSHESFLLQNLSKVKLSSPHPQRRIAKAGTVHYYVRPLVFKFVHESFHPSFCLSHVLPLIVCLCVDPYVFSLVLLPNLVAFHPFFCVSTYISIYPCLSLYPSIRPFVYTRAFPTILLSIRCPLCLSIHPFIYPLSPMSFHPFFRLSVCIWDGYI